VSVVGTPERRRVAFAPNPFIERNGRGSYATRETSLFDLEYQPAKDLGVHSDGPHQGSIVNRTAVARRGLGLPRLAAAPRLLAVVGADGGGYVPRPVAVRYWSCNADVTETCRPRTEPDDGSCTPDSQTYTWSACRWANGAIDQAVLRLSADDGLTWSAPVPVDASGATQSVAVAVTIHPVTRTVAVVYLRSGTALVLAVFDASGRRLGALVLHTFDARRAPWCDGSLVGASVVGTCAAGDFLVAFARVPIVTAHMPEAASGAPEGLELDGWERTRVAVAMVAASQF